MELKTVSAWSHNNGKLSSQTTLGENNTSPKPSLLEESSYKRDNQTHIS